MEINNTEYKKNKNGHSSSGCIGNLYCTVLYCAVLYWGEEQCRAGGIPCTSGDTTGTIGPGDSGSRASTGEPGTSRREVSNENIPENMM